MTRPVYCTREDVKSALDVAETARLDAHIDRLLDRASRAVETLCHRRFYPERDTRTFAWPDSQMGLSWRLWLGEHELISLDTLTSGGVDVDEWFLEPQASGPPFDRVEVDLSGPTGAFTSGDTYQRAISVTGTFGYTADTDTVAALDGAMDSAQAYLAVDDASQIGVGSLLLLGSEYVQVTGRSMSDTGQVLGAGLEFNDADVVLTVTDGTEFTVGEILLVDGERMLVVDQTPTTLVVRRAWDGSVLAAHSVGATVYASRTFRVARGQLGTTATSHVGVDVKVHVVPALVRDLTIAEALVGLSREQSGYARTIGNGETASGAPMTDIRDLRKQCFSAHGRIRTGVV